MKNVFYIASKTYSWNDISPHLDKSSEYDLNNFPNIFEAYYICNIVPEV